MIFEECEWLCVDGGGACMSLAVTRRPIASHVLHWLAKRKRDAVHFRCAGPSSPILVAGSTAVVCSCGFGTTAYVAVKMRLGKKSGKRIEILFWCPGPKARRPRRSLYRLPGCLTPFYAAACRACMGMLALEDTVLCTQVCSEAFISAVSKCGAVFFCRVVASYLHLANLVDYCLRLRLVRQHCVTVCG
uniref:Uncharacterized protein n=1 Tax=Rhipicephalus microplus TaxID=6941 RepID=A0A6G5AHJ4_RHIMP